VAAPSLARILRGFFGRGLTGFVAAFSFDLKLPDEGVGEAAARKPALPAGRFRAALATTTPATTIAAATATAISNVRPRLIRHSLPTDPQRKLGIGCEF